MTETQIPIWYSIRLKKGFKEKNAPTYARKLKFEDGTSRVILTNGAYVNFTVTQEEARKRYEIVTACSEERSASIEKRYQWEIHR